MSHKKALQLIDDINAGNVELKKGEEYADAYFRLYGKGFKTIGQGVINLGKTIVATLGKALLSAGISLIVTNIIQKGYELWDNWAHKAEKAKEAADDAKQSIKELNDEVVNTSKTVDSIKDRYAELAQKVNFIGTLGQNQGGLSNDEYKEFLDISNQLAEIFPQLTIGYDDNGNAIIDLSGDVDTIVGSLNDLVKAEEAVANREVLSSMGTLWTDYSYQVDDARESLEKLRTEFENGTEDALSFADAYEEWQKHKAEYSIDENGNVIATGAKYLADYDYAGTQNYLTEAMSRAGVYWDDVRVWDDLAEHYMYDFTKLSESQTKAIDDAFLNIKSEYSAQVKSYEDTIDQANREIGKYVSQSMKTVDYYEGLSDVEKRMMDTFIQNYDFESLQDQFYGNWEDAYNAFQTQMRESFGNVSEADHIMIQQYYDNLFAVDMSSGTYEENIEKIRSYARLIAAALGDEFSEIDILELLGFKNLGDKRVTAQKKGGYTYGRVTKDQTKHNEELNEWFDTFSDKDYDVYMTLSFDKNAAVEEQKRLFAELQNQADQNPIKVHTAAEAVDSMAKAKEAITSVEEIWQQTVQNNLALKKDKKFLGEDGTVNKAYDSQNMAVAYADPEKINAVESAFSAFIQEASDAGKDVDKLNLALTEFNRVMVEQPGDAEAAQKAIDNLITAYIDQTDIIQNLTEANAEWSIEQLKAYGITNAEAVVMSRLNSKVKELGKQFAACAESVKKLNTAEKDSPEWNASMENVQSKLSEMFTTDLGNGQTFVPEFDADWIVQNLDLITQAASGSYDAIYKLQQITAKKIAASVEINMPNQSMINGELSYINQLIDDFPIETVEVGTSLNDTPMIQGLNNLVDAGIITRDSMNAILSGIGVEPDITYEDVPVSMFSSASEMLKAAGYSATSGNPMVQAMARDFNNGVMGTVRIPKIDYKMSNKGVGASYSAPSGSSSGSGGGGGGGGGGGSEPNKPKEESEETFDWIEVAIQRIEEEIARLDKVVGNSYDIWINRNTALLKEINKTKEEIKAQQIAYKEYLRNANLVKVNNGKDLNPDDYGENDAKVKENDQRLLDEARAAWATGEYQKKVREGLMTGDDIEKIQNHFLSDTIKFYQELYNKAVSAKDAIQDLNIKLGDLARTNFDQVKTQAEDAIAYFDSYADLIDERISRTEERGYFVGKKYYDKLIEYENSKLPLLRKEYNDLIKKRDEAVQSGAISAYSEEWDKMNQEILDVGKSIEEATTNLVKFNNELRQLKWDAFDYARDRVSAFAEEFDFIIDLLDNQKIYDDYGAFNNRGWADVSMHAGKYNLYMEEALKYAEERKKVEKDLAKDEGNKTLIERREELIKLQQESIQNAYAEKDAVKELVEEGINIHLNKLQELIDKYKESLKEAKSLYDYEKNISKQTENISNLRKQLSAYSGDTSEEAKATIQKLQNQLKDAETQLKETQWDKYISETEDFLSDMYNDYEKVLKAKLDDVDALMADMIKDVNANGKATRKIVRTVANDVAYKLTDSMNTFLGNGSDGSLVSDFHKDFSNYSTTVMTSLTKINDYIDRISNNGVGNQIDETKIKGTNIKVSNVRNGVDYSDVFDINYYMNKYEDLQKAFGTDYDKYLDHFIQYGMKEGRQAIETFNVGTYMKTYQDLRDAYQKDLEKYYLHYIKWGKKEGRKAYATGAHNISSKQLALTQDGGGELLYRRSDGAILTPLNIGDKVFTTEMSENLWKLAQLKNPSLGGATSRIVTNNNAIAITLPNVTNYEQFKTALKNDPQMTKYFQQITIGEAGGSAKLNKRKY